MKDLHNLAALESYTFGVLKPLNLHLFNTPTVPNSVSMFLQILLNTISDLKIQVINDLAISLLLSSRSDLQVLGYHHRKFDILRSGNWNTSNQRCRFPTESRRKSDF